MIESNESGTVLTGESIEVYRVMTIRRGLIIKVDTGMNLTRISPLTAAQKSGLTDRRTYRGALQDVNAWLESRGVPVKWSKRYPNG